jgi:hypothetical protein
VSEYVRCVGCGEIVEAQEPCSCVFGVVGVLDTQGVLHTAERVPVEWTEEALDAAVAYMDEVEERAWLETERAAEWAVQQFVSQYGRDWLDEGDRMEMAYRRISAKDWTPPEGWACYECGTHRTDVKKRLCSDGVLASLCLDCWWDLYRN